MANNYLLFSETVVCRDALEAYDLGQELERHDENDMPPCKVQVNNREVWFYSEDSGNIEAVTQRLAEFQRHRRLGPIIVSWAYSCSKPRPGEFGGGAALVADGECVYFDPTTEAHARLAEDEVVRLSDG